MDACDFGRLADIDLRPSDPDSYKPVMIFAQDQGQEVVLKIVIPIAYDEDQKSGFEAEAALYRETSKLIADKTPHVVELVRVSNCVVHNLLQVVPNAIAPLWRGYMLGIWKDAEFQGQLDVLATTLDDEAPQYFRGYANLVQDLRAGMERKYVARFGSFYSQLHALAKELKDDLAGGMALELLQQFYAQPLLILETQRSPGVSLFEFAKTASEYELQIALFQLIWTLHIFSQIGLRHGDLHIGNVLVETDTDRDLSYIAHGERQLYWHMETNVMTKIFDWDFGGIYEPSFGFPAIANKYGEYHCNQVSSCRRNQKADLYTLLATLPWTALRARNFTATRAFAERAVGRQLLDFDWEAHGGFEHRLCYGPLQEQDDKCQYSTTDQVCQGPWEPRCIKTPLQLLNDPYFRNFKKPLPAPRGAYTDFEVAQRRRDVSPKRF